MTEARQARIIEQLERHGLDAFIYAGGPREAGEVHFLTGFRGFGGVVCWTREGGRLYVRPLDEAKASEETFCPAFGAQDPVKAAIESVADAAAIGIDPAAVRLVDYRAIAAALPNPESTVKDAGGFIQSLTLRKDPAQQDHLRAAGRAVTEAVEATFALLREGMSEAEAAQELGAEIYRHGGDAIAFKLVSFGENTAFPHHFPSRSRRLAPADLVMIDCGAMVEGMASDITRTVVWGEASGRQRELYDLVWRAQEAALETTCIGAIAEDVDAAARDVISAAGFGDQFIHSLGHGLGLSSGPRLRVGDRTRLEAGMAFTIEPGVYLSGIGGVRIEDDVLLTPEGSELLTASRSPELIVLPR